MLSIAKSCCYFCCLIHSLGSFPFVMSQKECRHLRTNGGCKQRAKCGVPVEIQPLTPSKVNEPIQPIRTRGEKGCFKWLVSDDKAVSCWLPLAGHTGLETRESKLSEERRVNIHTGGFIDVVLIMALVLRQF